jgi:hypothetical protein
MWEERNARKKMQWRTRTKLNLRVHLGTYFLEGYLPIFTNTRYVKSFSYFFMIKKRNEWHAKFLKPRAPIAKKFTAAEPLSLLTKKYYSKVSLDSDCESQNDKQYLSPGLRKVC